MASHLIVTGGHNISFMLQRRIDGGKDNLGLIPPVEAGGLRPYAFLDRRCPPL